MASECKWAGGWIVVCIYIYIYNFIFSLSFFSLFSSPWNKLDLAKTATKARDVALALGLVELAFSLCELEFSLFQLVLNCRDPAKIGAEDETF